MSGPVARRRMRPAGGKAPGAAFTLVELLFVVAILGVLAVVAAPRVGALLSGGALRTGARELAGAGRYARTMALLNQTPVDVAVEGSPPRLSITARERDSASWLGMSDLAAVTNDVGYTDELLRTSARRTASLGSGFGLAVSKNDADAGAATNLFAALAAAGSGEEDADAPAATVSLADSVNAEREIPGVKISFGGWRDVASTRSRGGGALSGGTDGQDGGAMVVRYRANGTVRPHRWVVSDPEHEDLKLYVDVNAVGRAKITSPDDDR